MEYFLLAEGRTLELFCGAGPVSGTATSVLYPASQYLSIPFVGPRCYDPCIFSISTVCDAVTPVTSFFQDFL